MASNWKRALVTGASSGIGEATARRLAIAGTSLVLVARDQGRLESLADELDNYHDVTVEVLPADLADHTQLRVVEHRLLADDHPVDLLVNNAGFGTHGKFPDLPVDPEETEILVNTLAVMRLAHAAAAGMRRRRTGDPDGRPVGGILNVSSIAAFQPTPSMATYAATKSFVLSFSQSLHEELRAEGIVVTCLCPGFTRTRFQERAQYDRPVPRPLWLTPEAVAAAGLAGVAAGRSTVVPGHAYKALHVGTRVLPGRALRWLAARVSAP
jgi:short-subunit dehydrogenase